MDDAFSLNEQMQLWILHQWIGIKLEDPILLAVFRHINGDFSLEASILSQASAVPSLRTQAAQQAANEAFNRVVAAMAALGIRFSGTDRGRPFGSDAVNTIGAGAPSVLQFGANQAGAQNGAYDPLHGFNIGDFDFGGEVGGFDGPFEGFGEDEAGYEEGGHEENGGEEDDNFQKDDEEQSGDCEAPHAEDGDAQEEGPAKKKKKITVRLTWSADMRRALCLMFPDDNAEDTDWYRWVPVLQHMFLVFRGLSFDEVVSKCRPLRREIINQDPSRFAKWAEILGQPGELARVQVDIINAERAIAQAPQGAASAAAASNAGTADASAALASAGDDNLLYIPDARLPLDPPVTLSEMYDNYIEDPEVIWERNRIFLLAEAVSRWIDEHLNLAEAADYLQALLASEGTTSWSNEQLRAILSFNNTRILDALLLVQHERAAFGVREHQWDVDLAKAYSSNHPSLAPLAPAGDAFFRPFEMIHYVDVDFSIDPSHPRVYVTANQQPFFIDHDDPVFQRNGKVYPVLLVDQRSRSMRVDCQICDINFCKHCNPTRKLADCPLGFPFPFVHRDDVKGTIFHGNGPREAHMQAEGIADAKEVVYGDGAKRMTSVCRGGNCRRCG